jgi:soluble lytic murein transglycosylase-like protein
VAQSLRRLKVMTLKLFCSILLLVTLAVAGNAQRSTDGEASLHERAVRLEPFIEDASKRYGVDPQILRTLCFLESRYQLDVVSPKGARGPMQFMPATASKYGLQNPHDPRSAIDAAARYLRDLLRKFNGRTDLAIAAYNAGEGTVEAFLTGRSIRLADGKIINPGNVRTGGIPPYPETKQYVRAALTLLAIKPEPSRINSFFQLRESAPSRRFTDRDFTLDVTMNQISPPKRSKENASSSFIEIQ